MCVVLLGRRMFSIFFGPEASMHDIYAFGIGLYTLIATVMITEFVAEKASILVHQDRAAFHSSLRTFIFRSVKWIYLGLFAGVVLPLIWGVCLDLYIMMPFRRLIISPGTKHELQLMQDWAFGVIHMKIAGRIILYLDGRHARAMRNVSPLRCQM